MSIAAHEYDIGISMHHPGLGGRVRKWVHDHNYFSRTDPRLDPLQPTNHFQYALLDESNPAYRLPGLSHEDSITYMNTHRITIAALEKLKNAGPDQLRKMHAVGTITENLNGLAFTHKDVNTPPGKIHEFYILIRNSDNRVYFAHRLALTTDGYLGAKLDRNGRPVLVHEAGDEIPGIDADGTPVTIKNASQLLGKESKLVKSAAARLLELPLSASALEEPPAPEDPPSEPLISPFYYDEPLEWVERLREQITTQPPDQNQNPEMNPPSQLSDFSHIQPGSMSVSSLIDPKFFPSWLQEAKPADPVLQQASFSYRSTEDPSRMRPQPLMRGAQLLFGGSNLDSLSGIADDGNRLQLALTRYEAYAADHPLTPPPAMPDFSLASLPNLNEEEYYTPPMTRQPVHARRLPQSERLHAPVAVLSKSTSYGGMANGLRQRDDIPLGAAAYATHYEPARSPGPKRTLATMIGKGYRRY